MNLLFDRLPHSVIVSGKEYDIDTDFTTSIRFELLMLDSSIEDEEKAALALNLYYPIIPSNTNEALAAVHSFYAGTNEQSTGGKSGTGKRIYDFDCDAPYIYAAFRSDYSIDLTHEEHLHWWVFRALFAALSEQNLFCKIMGYRAVDLKQFKGDERKFYRNMQKQFAIPMQKSERNKLDAINKVLLNGGDVSKVLKD